MAGPTRRPGPQARKELARLLVRRGAPSRTAAVELVRAGRVRVDGALVLDPRALVSPDAEIRVDGRAAAAPKRVVVMLHKPVGCVTTTRDPQGRPTVFALLQGAPEGLRAIGRLDLDTSGLLLFTNDTLLVEALASPAAHVPKAYEVRTQPRLSDAQLARLASGVELADGPARALEVARVASPDSGRWIRLVIDEGRNRQVRRMCAAVGAKVRELRRVSIGALELGALAPAAWRVLRNEELERALGRRA